jgi:hypothetical protein
MNLLRKALPLVLSLLLLVLAYRDFRQQQKRLPVVWAQANNTLYDTLYSQTLSAAIPGTAQGNSFTGGQSMSRSFAVEYYTDGFSALSLQFETCLANADGTISTCTAVPNTICSSSVQPPCVIDGANPSTTTGYATFSVSAYSPWFRVNVTSVTGSGHINYRIYGYKGLSARSRSGNGGGGATGATGATGVGATGATGASGAAGAGRPLGLMFDGGGTALVGTSTKCFPQIATFVIGSADLIADTNTNSFTIDVRVASQAAYNASGSSAASSITAAAIPTMANAYETVPNVATWTKTITGPAEVCYVLTVTSGTSTTAGIALGQ